jgi:hypothetical protein
MTKRPGRIKEVIDIADIIDGDHWRSHSYDETIRRPAFQDLRARVWDLVKNEIEPRH